MPAELPTHQQVPASYKPKMMGLHIFAAPKAEPFRSELQKSVNFFETQFLSQVKRNFVSPFKALTAPIEVEAQLSVCRNRQPGAEEHIGAVLIQFSPGSGSIYRFKFPGCWFRRRCFHMFFVSGDFAFSFSCASDILELRQIAQWGNSKSSKNRLPAIVHLYVCCLLLCLWCSWTEACQFVASFFGWQVPGQRRRSWCLNVSLLHCKWQRLEFSTKSKTKEQKKVVVSKCQKVCLF